MPIFALPIEKTGLVLKVLQVAEVVYRKGFTKKKLLKILKINFAV